MILSLLDLVMAAAGYDVRHPFEEGQIAYQRNESRDSTIYSGKEAEEWIRGWDHAKDSDEAYRGWKD